jgi:hypothetical protein
MNKESTSTHQIAMTPVRCLEEDETSGTFHSSPPRMERKRYLATDGFLQLNQNQNFPSLFIPTLDHRIVHQTGVEKDHDSTSFYLMPRKKLHFRSTRKVTNECCISHHYGQSWQRNGYHEAPMIGDNLFIPIDRNLNSEV